MEKSKQVDILTKLIRNEISNKQNKFLIKQFVKQHPELINELDSDRFTPLATACNLQTRSRFNPSIKFLLKNGADPNALCSGYKSPFHLICMSTFSNANSKKNNNDLNTIKLLLKHSTIRNDIINITLCGDNALMLAINYAFNNDEPIDKELIRLLLKAGINCNLQNNLGQTPLYLATKCGYSNNNNVIKLLLSYGADIHTVSMFKWSPLMSAIMNAKNKQDFNIIDLFLEYGCDFDLKNVDGWTALMVFCKYKIMLDTDTNDTLKLLIKHTSNINHVNKNGWTALMLALQNGNSEQIKILLEAGSNPNITTFYGSSCLKTIFCREKSEFRHEIFELLLNYGANINHRNKLDDTILMMIGNPIKYKSFINEESDYERFKYTKSLIYHYPGFYLKSYSSADHNRITKYMTRKGRVWFSKVIDDINKQKTIINSVLTQIPQRCGEIIYGIDSLRTQLLNIKWQIRNMNMNINDIYTINTKSRLINYFGITDTEKFQNTIDFYINNNYV
ncbi:putative ankyrin repeat protein [Cotonvirus japonicus]|uniref:Ankyrin repeat protein n=1 Tax=Cotonvirus japonicus TaxID=2811091 RepID=A0ABM7NRP4_9VIRU|nr:putative ankyrin repeat protein [Cotonvirus japonicus]BCS82832.1 putative ankyrin repeat protein [Cotonvirus japonicus]